MENKNEVAAPIMHSYDDFEPYCNWQKDEGHDTLVVHLPEFKKNQLKVQINNLGVLTITGERPINEKKWSRFRKQVKISNNCSAKDINAKFVGGLLYLIMPHKSNAPVATPNNQGTKEIETPNNQGTKEIEKPNLETSQGKASEKSKEADKSDNVVKEDKIKSTENDMCQKTNYKFYQDTLARRSRFNKKVAVSVAVVVVAAAAAFGAYMSYKRNAIYSDRFVFPTYLNDINV